MRRRTIPEPDRLANVAISQEFLERLSQVLQALSEREAGVLRLRYGLVDGWPRDWDVIAQVYGVTAEKVRLIESKALQKIRRFDRSFALRPYLDHELGHLRSIRDRMSADMGDAPDLVWCDQHGWQAPETSKVCAHCPCPLPARGGRPRRYCSDACRQAAYRQRKAGST